jgi:hypothetical protein
MDLGPAPLPHAVAALGKWGGEGLPDEPACRTLAEDLAALAGTPTLALLARNHGLIASFSRALTEGLTAQQSDQEFNAALDASIASIHRASVT